MADWLRHWSATPARSVRFRLESPNNIPIVQWTEYEATNFETRVRILVGMPNMPP